MWYVSLFFNNFHTLGFPFLGSERVTTKSNDVDVVIDCMLSIFSAGFLTMTVDDTNSHLVTGDADGVIKVWDILEYCVGCMAEDDNPPREYHLDCSKTSLQQQNVYQTVEVFHA